MRQNIAFYKHGCSGIEDLTGCNFTDALFQKALLIRNRKLLYFVLVFFFCSFSVINSNSPRLLLDYYNCYFNFKELYIATRNINIKLIGKVIISREFFYFYFSVFYVYLRNIRRNHEFKFDVHSSLSGN